MDNSRKETKATNKSQNPSISAKSESKNGAHIKVHDPLDAFYNNLPFIGFVLDEIGRILSLNNWGASQLGYTTEELRDRPIFH